MDAVSHLEDAEKASSESASGDDSATKVVPIITDSMSYPTVFCRTATQDGDEYFRSFVLVYVAEGSANIVFRTLPYDEFDPACQHRIPLILYKYPNEILQLPAGKVFRVNKEKATSQSRTEQIKHEFEKHIAPLFPGQLAEHLLEPVLVELDTLVLSLLLVELQWQERPGGHRPQGRHGDMSIEQDQPTCLMLDDMSSRPKKDIFTIEIKPKWLVQSPNAPRYAYRCRNCALRAHRAVLNPDSITNAPRASNSICPLRLVRPTNNSITLMENYLASRLWTLLNFRHVPHYASDAIVKAVQRYMMQDQGQQLLQHLAKLQDRLDPEGIMNVGHAEDYEKKNDRLQRASLELRTAMTLRDCSMFIQVQWDIFTETAKVRCKLADLDLKPRGRKKTEQWFRQERALRNGGWYAGKESNPRKEELCILAEKELPYHW